MYKNKYVMNTRTQLLYAQSRVRYVSLRGGKSEVAHGKLSNLEHNSYRYWMICSDRIRCVFRGSKSRLLDSAECKRLVYIMRVVIHRTINHSKRHPTESQL